MNEQIASDFKEAMKSQDKFSLSVLRMLKSAIQMEAINKKHDLSDEEVINVIKKQVKMRKDSIVEYQKYEKAEEVESLQKEIDVLSKYLPEEATEEQIIAAVEKAFGVVNPTSMKDMGAILNEIAKELPNADKSIISKLVKEKLN